MPAFSAFNELTLVASNKVSTSKTQSKVESTCVNVMFQLGLKLLILLLEKVILPRKVRVNVIFIEVELLVVRERDQNPKDDFYFIIHSCC